MPESSSTPRPPAEPDAGYDGTGEDDQAFLVDAPTWARLVLVLAPFLVGGLVILLLRIFGG